MRWRLLRLSYYDLSEGTKSTILQQKRNHNEEELLEEIFAGDPPQDDAHKSAG